MNKQVIEKAIEFLSRYLDDEVYTEQCIRSHMMAISALQQQLTNGWIPCKDGFPDKNGNYVVSVFNNQNNKSITMVSSWQVTVGLFGIEDSYQRVIAWQPLPPEYKEPPHE
jgi:hypothetical protein